LENSGRHNGLVKTKREANLAGHRKWRRVFLR
jgi:hypothetical protein